MTIRHLHIFKLVCECQSITLAADKLNITQPSVSIAIKELESFYNTKLFDRVNRKIYLTEEGETLRQYAYKILEQFEEATKVLRNEGNFSNCRIGVNISVSETILPNLMSTAKAKFPRLHPTIFVHNNETIEQKLSNNSIDFAILDRIKDRHSKITSLFYTDEMSIICSPEFYEKEEITVKELAQYPMLMREQGSGLRNCVDAVFLKHECAINVVAESMSTLSLIELAEKGIGFAVIPNKIAQEMCNSHKLKTINLLDDSFKRDYYLIYNNKKHFTPTMKKFIELISLENKQ